MRNLNAAWLMMTVVVVVVAGCAPDAPHDNPLDPASPNRKIVGNLGGKVLTLFSLSAGISGALVTIEGTNQAVLTATDGSFDFSSAPSGDIAVVITKSSYLSDTIYLKLAVGGNLDTSVHLDALPLVDSARIATSMIDQWYPGPVYIDTVSAAVTDPDGFLDINTVYVCIDSLTFAMTRSAGDVFQVAINADSLPNQDPQWIVGKQLEVFAVDQEKGVGRSSGFYVTRTIESEPKPTSPQSADTITTGFPTFEWDPPTLSFDYTFQLKVVSLAGGAQTLVWSKAGISSSIFSYDFHDSGDSLADGEYYWTVAAIDQFGNSSRSKEAAFIVRSQ